MLRNPLLYLSLYFKARRGEYCDLLNQVCTEGDWEKWLGFFAVGIREMAENEVDTAKKLLQVSDLGSIQQLGRLAGSCLQVHPASKRRPVGTVASLSNETGLSLPTVTAALRKLEEMGLVKETAGRRRNRVFTYRHYLEILTKETVP